MKKIIAFNLILFLNLLTAPIFALSVAPEANNRDFTEQYQVEIVLTLVLLVSILVLVVLIVALQAMKAFIKMNKPETSVEKEVSVWKKFILSMTNAVPIEQEQDILTDHAYDGIQELDNNLPPWWLYGFYCSIIFGFLYVGYYHFYITDDNLQEAEYVAEVAEAKEKIEIYLASLENSIDESNVELLTEDTELIAGKEYYDKSCKVCHGDAGQGGIGPNFADKYWLHGGDVKAVFKTIKYGVPEKGMISWQNQFTPKQMQQLSSFIISLEGTNPPGQKDPQGELFEREKNSEDQEKKEKEPSTEQAQL